MAKRRFWLMKSEPDVYGIDDLERDGSTYWEGVRNYQARNFLRDDVQVGDGVLYYHSRQDPPGIVGLARIAKAAYPDPTQFDPKSKYYDPKATEETPRWVVVDLEFVAKLDQVLSLAELKDDPKLAEMLVVQKGQRLSVQPVEAIHWRHILKKAKIQVEPGR
jgi:predicted RNA-binding protein with PUA-like domain